MISADLIFDLDGTLVDSAPGIINSFTHILREQGIEPAQPIDSSIIGPPLKETLSRISGFSTPERLTSLEESFKLYYDHQGILQTEVYPGIDVLLKRLHAEGYRLHIATNKRLAATSKILSLFEWDDLFSSVYALDMVSPRIADKASLIQRQITELKLDQKRIIYVGDRIEDGEAADRQPIPFYLAYWGYGVDESRLKAHWIPLHSPQELIRKLNNNHGEN
jgi:phosphoglycolate phosphatase